MDGTERQPLPELMTVKEVAELLRFSPRRVRQMAQEGILPSIAIPTGKRVTYRFERVKIEERLDSFTSGTAGGLPANGTPDA